MTGARMCAEVIFTDHVHEFSHGHPQSQPRDQDGPGGGGGGGGGVRGRLRQLTSGELLSTELISKVESS